VTELSRQVSNQLIENKSQCRVYCNLDWIISDDTVVRPDLMVVCGQQPERHLDHAPDLAVEVLSESTRQHDLTVKRALYLENQVAHYLVVDPSANTLLLASANGEISFGQGETISLTLGKDGCHVEIECGRLFE
jgi:Uma2 family endonuclease